MSGYDMKKHQKLLEDVQKALDELQEVQNDIAYDNLIVVNLYECRGNVKKVIDHLDSILLKDK